MIIPKIPIGESQTFSKQLDTEIKREQERKLQASELTTVLGIALVTILSLLTLSLYKNNNLRAKANELLQAKNTELILAKENAEKASMVKAQFLSTITHELRTPMYAVTGLTHLLLSENPTPEQKKAFGLSEIFRRIPLIINQQYSRFKQARSKQS